MPVIEAALDASALIAFLRNEPGAEQVAALLAGACVSSVNLAETLSKMAAYGKPIDASGYQIERLKIPVVPFDGEMARIVASLWQAGRMAGLSLGDRACLALGLKRGCPVVTADRKWAELAIGVQVIPIR